MHKKETLKLWDPNINMQGWICNGSLNLPLRNINISNRSLEPFSRIQHPPEHYQTQTSTYSHRRIVESTPGKRVISWQKKDWAGITNPQKGNDANWPPCFPQVKRPSFEILLVHNNSCKDWNCIASNPSNCTYWSYGSEDYIDSQDRESKKNADGCT